MTSRPALLLIPGLLCDEQIWAPQVEALHKIADIAVADHELCDSLPAMAQKALDKMSRHRRFAVAGHSMGGRVALELYRVAGERVDRLALLDTGYEGLASDVAGEQEAARRHALLDIAQREGMRVMGRQWAQGMVYPARLQDRALMDAIHDMVERKTPEQFAAQIRALLGRPDAADVLPAIRCPTLVLCGEQDAWSPLSRHVEIAAKIAGSTLVSIADCGHMSTMERPAAVSDAMRRWLNN